MRNLLFFVIAIVSFTACRKGPIPEYNAFKPGTYIYDFKWNDTTYENFLKLNIGLPNADKDYSQEVLSFYYDRNYEIPTLSNDPIRYEISYLKSGHYRLFDGGLYYVQNGSGIVSLSTDYYLKVPAPATGLRTIDLNECDGYSRLPYEPTTISQDKIAISYAGNTYSTNKIVVGSGKNCIRDSKHVLYIDEQYGLIRYEIYDLITDILKGTFTLRSID